MVIQFTMAYAWVAIQLTEKIIVTCGDRTFEHYMLIARHSNAIHAHYRHMGHNVVCKNDSYIATYCFPQRSHNLAPLNCLPLG